jgi:predicted anti-sigma-YlaC factor YlaD
MYSTFIGLVLFFFNRTLWPRAFLLLVVLFANFVAKPAQMVLVAGFFFSYSTTSYKTHCVRHAAVYGVRGTNVNRRNKTAPMRFDNGRQQLQANVVFTYLRSAPPQVLD